MASPKNTAIFTKEGCPFCTKIKRVYEEKGWNFQEYKLDVNFTRDQFYGEFGFGATFPQLKVDGKNIGGCNESIQQFRQQGFL
tara:strand:- start:12142 stop:12390 length:249 start_codon:yes stop_codon:yes gene_type:complete